MGRGAMVVAGVGVVALLLITIAACVRLLMLLVQLVTLRYTLTIGALALTFWLVNARRQRYAKGFYSCSRVPSMDVKAAQQSEGETYKEEDKIQEEVPVTCSEVLSSRQKKVTTAPPSETESEEDDSEVIVGKEEASDTKTTPTNTPCARHSMSLMDVRACCYTTNGEEQWQQTTRPRSSSTVDDGRSSRLNTCMSSYSIGKQHKRRVPRRRADTGMTNKSQQNERSRRATFASKQDTDTGPSPDKVEDALRVNGYWIGDFRVERRLSSRRSYTNSPKAK
ncbi:unnamed protein product [Peronospora farinosa]|uniref:Uncharacterized protein n=1 Tax=Peronospora farinosa TaxID=134698 RepID=A0AAV0ULJ1_9STRA|nr:unnamed protein product [Peronospora farinosa]CAI5735594.1 unnamed protein product [Peronospora farinosa]